MAVQQGQSGPRGTLQNIITYLCFKANPISERKLTKLVYLVDVYYCELYGKRATDVSFKHYLYGAWAPEIAQSLEELYAAGILEERVIDTKTGHRATLPKPRVKKTTIALPRELMSVLELVIEDWGAASPDEVVKFSKTTLPFLNTPFHAVIEFCRTDPIVEYANQHALSENEAATDDVFLNPSLVNSVLEGAESLRRGARPLTHHEVFPH